MTLQLVMLRLMLPKGEGEVLNIGWHGIRNSCIISTNIYKLLSNPPEKHAAVIVYGRGFGSVKRESFFFRYILSNKPVTEHREMTVLRRGQQREQCREPFLISARFHLWFLTYKLRLNPRRRRFRRYLLYLDTTKRCLFARCRHRNLTAT